MITFVIENASAAYIQKSTMEEREIVKNLLSYNQYVVLPQYGNKPTVVKISELKRNKFFGPGLIPYICTELERIEIEYEIYEKENNFKELDIKKEVKFKGVTLEDYQEKVLKKIENYTRGIIVSSTGSGKTLITAGIIKKFNVPKTLIIVPTREIASNTVKTLEKLFNQEIGLYSSNSKNFQRITVMLYQSLSRFKDKSKLNKEIQLIIIDEVDVASDQMEKILKEMPDIHYRFGLTATPPSASNKRKIFLKVTGQIGEKIITITDKQASTRLAKVEAYMFEKDFHITTGKFEEIYRPQILLNRERARHLLSMTDWGFKTKEIKTCLLLVDELEQAKLIKDVYLNSEYKNIPHTPVIAHGKLSLEDLVAIKDKLNNNEISFVISTPVFSRGTDIPNIDCICLGSIRKSHRNTIQKIGRGRRRTEKKDKMILLDSYDIGKYVSNYSETRKNLYKAKKWLKDVFEEEYAYGHFSRKRNQ